jgi:hypothetical protein
MSANGAVKGKRLDIEHTQFLRELYFDGSLHKELTFATKVQKLRADSEEMNFQIVN